MSTKSGVSCWQGTTEFVGTGIILHIISDVAYWRFGNSQQMTHRCLESFSFREQFRGYWVRLIYKRWLGSVWKGILDPHGMVASRIPQEDSAVQLHIQVISVSTLSTPASSVDLAAHPACLVFLSHFPTSLAQQHSLQSLLARRQI